MSINLRTPGQKPKKVKNTYDIIQKIILNCMDCGPTCVGCNLKNDGARLDDCLFNGVPERWDIRKITRKLNKSKL